MPCLGELTNKAHRFTLCFIPLLIPPTSHDLECAPHSLLYSNQYLCSYCPTANCTEVPGVYTCDSNGTLVCVNASCDPQTQCMMCNTTEPGMKWNKKISNINNCQMLLLLRASERSERSEHTVVLSLTFLSIYI